jgi:hypothetical protein
MKLCPGVKVRGFPHDSYWRCLHCGAELWVTRAGRWWFPGPPTANGGGLLEALYRQYEAPASQR